MKNKEGIILDNPLERYMETDRSYYKNYGFIFKYDEDSIKKHFDYLKQNYKKKYNDKNLLEFGDLIKIYKADQKVIYLYKNDKFNYVCTELDDEILNIFRVADDNIEMICDTISDLDKKIILFKLKSMLNKNIGIPKNSRSSLVKLLRK